MSAAAIAVLAAVAVLAVLLVAYEQGGGGPREVALVATLAAAAAAGRVLLGPIPSAQPVTAIVLCTGVALGPRAGAAVGALAPLLSNAFLGQGPWTPWQMAAWAAAGVSGGVLGRLLRHRGALVAVGVLWGLLYGALLNLWQLAAFGPVLSPRAFWLTELRGLPFDVVHAATNAVLLAVAGPGLVRLLDRYARRLRVTAAVPAPDPDPVP